MEVSLRTDKTRMDPYDYNIIYMTKLILTRSYVSGLRGSGVAARIVSEITILSLLIFILQCNSTEPSLTF